MTKISDQGPLRPDSVPELPEKSRTGKAKAGDKRDVEKEADDFASLLKGADHKKGGKDTGSGDFPVRDTPPRSPADAMIQSLQNRTRSDSAATAEGTQSSPSISKVAQEIADRILVSDLSKGGGEEVRIHIKDSVLPGTEIRILKDGENIRLEILTSSNESHRLLSDHKGGLQEALKERVSDSVSVEVKFNESDREERDGRSRQQRNLYEEMEE